MVEAGLRIGEAVAANHDTPLNENRRLGLVDRVKQLGSGRDGARRKCLLAGHRIAHETEVHLRRLAEQCLQLGRIVEARHLHQDSVEALLLDDRFGRTEFVDTAADDLDCCTAD